MYHNHRANERFEDFGHVEADELCSLAGILDDISLNGCRVHFPLPITVDMDKEYHLNIKLSPMEKTPLRLLCIPKWNLRNESKTEIGFSFLRSIDTRRLESYINSKHNWENQSTSIYNLIINNKPVFVN